MVRHRQTDDHPTDDTPAVPTPKEAKFLDLYIEHGDIAKAARESGVYKPRGAGSRPDAVAAGRRTIEKFKPDLNRLMDHKGLTFPALLDKLNLGLDAESAFMVGRGEDRHVETYPDHRSRTKYLEMAFKIRGAFPATPAVVKVTGDKDAAPITVQHYEKIKELPVEERRRRLDEMIEATKRGPLRLVGAP